MGQQRQRGELRCGAAAAPSGQAGGGAGGGVFLCRVDQAPKDYMGPCNQSPEMLRLRGHVESAGGAEPGSLGGWMPGLLGLGCLYQGPRTKPRPILG